VSFNVYNRDTKQRVESQDQRVKDLEWWRKHEDPEKDEDVVFNPFQTKDFKKVLARKENKNEVDLDRVNEDYEDFLCLDSNRAHSVVEKNITLRNLKHFPGQSQLLKLNLSRRNVLGSDKEYVELELKKLKQRIQFDSTRIKKRKMTIASGLTMGILKMVNNCRQSILDPQSILKQERQSSVTIPRQSTLNAFK
jgi:hypothetical protein